MLFEKKMFCYTTAYLKIVKQPISKLVSIFEPQP